MFKVPAITTLLVVALCWFTVSCTGPVFIHPPAAATTAAATTPAPAAAPLAVGTYNGMYFACAMLAFAGLGISMFALRGKAPEMA